MCRRIAVHFEGSLGLRGGEQFWGGTPGPLLSGCHVSNTHVATYHYVRIFRRVTS